MSADLIARLDKMAKGYEAVAGRWRVHPEIWADAKIRAAAVDQMDCKAATLREAIRVIRAPK